MRAAIGQRLPRGTLRRVRLRLDAASAGRGRVSWGGERAAQSGRVCRVRRRPEWGNRVVVGRRLTTLWGSVRGGERRRDVATNRKKGRRNGGRREFALSASRVNCWGGRSAPDRQAPRTVRPRAGIRREFPEQNHRWTVVT